MPDLHEAALSTSDLSASRRFFEEALGLSPARVGDTSTSYDTGPCELKLQADFPPNVRDSFGLPEPPGDGRGGGVMHVLELDDSLDAIYERVAAAVGGAALIEPREAPWGVRMFLAQSPEGYVFEVRGADR